MTMPATDFNQPRGSFPTPVKPIGVGPLEGPLVSVSFNYQWCQVIVGSLSQLLLNTTWDVATQDELTAIQENVFDLMSAFCANPPPAGPPIIAQVGASEDFMLRQNPTNPCELQTSVDGTNWCTWADLSKCLANTQQPGSGTPQPTPGGGCQEYDMYLEANGQWLIPTFFNDGDTIELTDITGAGADGTVNHWYCPNGQAFVLGACVGLTGTSSGDPDPTQPHMSLLLNVGGVYFPLTTGPITLTGIAAGQYAYIQVNDSILSDNAGSYRAKVKVCNNQATSWTKTFDFTANPCGLTHPIPGRPDRTVWAAGVGYDTLDSVSSGCNERLLEGQIDFSTPIAFTSVDVEYDWTAGAGDCGPTYHMEIALNNEATVLYNQPAGSVPAGTSKHLVFSAGYTGVNNLQFFWATDDTSGTRSGLAHLKSVTLSGSGTEPTWPC